MCDSGAVPDISTKGYQRKDSMHKDSLWQEWKTLALARLEICDPGLILHIGQWEGTLRDAKDEVTRETEVGKIMIRGEKDFLQNLKTFPWYGHEEIKD